MKKAARFFMLLALALPLAAQDLASIEKRVTVKKLDNGLTVIVMERPEAPVFSFATMVNVGAAQEVPGITGLAHMFEHMAFKGTDKIGTTDYAAEQAALQKVEETYAAYDRARRDPISHDAAKVAEAEKAWKAAADDANKYVVANEFTKIVQRAGATNINAFTSNDETGYFYSLPSNRVELWAYLDSERFLHPVFREFYKERDVVFEERRMRGVHGASVRAAGGRLAFGPAQLLRDRRRRVLQEVLRAGEHVHRHRRRRESGRGDADRGEVLRPSAEGAGAGAAAHRRAAAEGGAHRGAARVVAADLPGGLSPRLGHRSRRCGLLDDPGRAGAGTHLAPLPLARARQEARRERGQLRGLPR